MDLHPIRAAMAETMEQCDYTSVQRNNLSKRQSQRQALQRQRLFGHVDLGIFASSRLVSTAYGREQARLDTTRSAAGVGAAWYRRGHLRCACQGVRQAVLQFGRQSKSVSDERSLKTRRRLYQRRPVQELAVTDQGRVLHGSERYRIDRLSNGPRP